ncbi:hypothetical protein ACFQ1Q_04660 [Winogradskyella litorisediminis]|uniref:Lipoprotein n=1 Tax=Winogradskyella litorisediminis TaxID=1156618 RepID=A0ABW3N6J2_9FLAO
MKSIKIFIKLLCLALLTVSFSQCASTMKLEKEAPTTFGETYYQNWVAGVQGGGSGINVFIEVNSKSIQLDSIYFRGNIAKLQTKPSNKQMYIGRFSTEANKSLYETLSKSDVKLQDEDFPFKLDNSECVVSYSEDGKQKYFKISNLKEKPLEALPMSAPPNKN